MADYDRANVGVMKESCAIFEISLKNISDSGPLADRIVDNAATN